LDNDTWQIVTIYAYKLGNSIRFTQLLSGGTALAHTKMTFLRITDLETTFLAISRDWVIEIGRGFRYLVRMAVLQVGMDSKTVDSLD